ncbi:MAG: HAD-IA family hydrolase [Propionibacteriaceae bacterium]|jgi:putative hydrolase of the HAD superfamily|nr:HAD-IA family hydrolase [Propionibacteriaceae bacterium]
MGFRTIVFDMGHVLIVDEAEDFIPRYIAEPELQALVHQELMKGPEWVELDRGTMSLEDAGASVARRMPPGRDWAPLLTHMLYEWHTEVDLIDGMGPLIERLKAAGNGIYLLSNTSITYHDRRHLLPALDCFDGEFISADEHLLKPTAEMYQGFLARFGLDGQECFFVDDRDENVAGAVAAGFGGGFPFRGDAAELEEVLLQAGVVIAPAERREIKQVVFDMGNVLVYDDMPGYVAASVTDPADADLVYRELMRGPEWARWDAGTITEQGLIDAVCAKLPERLHAVTADLVHGWHRATTPVDGIESLIRRLKAAGYGIYLLSNTATTYYDYRANLPAIDLFDGEFISADHHVVKPDRAIYDEFCATFGLTPAECLFIDDTVANARGAQDAGWTGYAFDLDVAKLEKALAWLGVTPAAAAAAAE